MTKGKEVILDEIAKFTCPMAVSKFYPRISNFTDAKPREMEKENYVQVWIGKGKVNAGESLWEKPTSNWKSFPNYLQLKTWETEGTAYTFDFLGAILGAT